MVFCFFGFFLQEFKGDFALKYLKYWEILVSLNQVSEHDLK